MAEETRDQIEHLQKMISSLTKNLHIMEQQAAGFGPLHVPPFLKRQMSETRQEIARLKEELTVLQAASPEGAPPLPCIPQNLPSRGEFIGREKEKEDLRQALASRSYLVAIEGIGGIGKTALALEIAHECWEERRFEAVIWTTARERPIDLTNVLDTIARTLDYPYIAQMPPGEEKEREATKRLRAQTCLLIVDNFETIEDEGVSRFLKNLPEPSKALITSRHPTVGGARLLPLKGMEPDEALKLIRSEGHRLSLESVQQAEDRILLRLYEATGGAPLAIRWAVGQIAQRGQSLDSVLDSLRGAKDDVFGFMFNRSWEMLEEEARRILTVMPIFASSASKGAIEAASGVGGWDFDEGLAQLVEMRLIEVSGGLEEEPRYEVHPLTRAFGGRELRKDLTLEEEAYLRAAEHYLETLAPYGGRYNWTGYKGYDEIEKEAENIFAIREWCWAAKKWEMLLRLQDLLSLFLYTRGYWQERIRFGEQALQAAECLEDSASRIEILLEDIGWTLVRFADMESMMKGQRHIQKAFEISLRSEKPFYTVRAQLRLGILAAWWKDYTKAAEWYEAALEIIAKGDVTDKGLIARLKYSLGFLAYEQENYEEMRKHFEDAFIIYKDLGDEIGTLRILRRNADLELDCGDLEEAWRLYHESLVLSQRVSRPDYIASSARELAKVEEKQGLRESALRWARKSLEIDERLGAERHIEESRQLVARLERALAAEENNEHNNEHQN